jgi:hypothetical protein
MKNEKHGKHGKLGARILGASILIGGAINAGGCLVGAPEETEAEQAVLSAAPTTSATILAELHPDADTTIFFVEADNGELDRSVDVVIKGRDGGIDYGAPIVAGATPLELFVAIAGTDAAIPQALQAAHELEATHTRDGDLQIRPLDLPPPVIGPGEIEEKWGPSTFTCKSFSNFQEQMSAQLTPGTHRSELTSFDDTGVHALVSPGINSHWTQGEADAYICNFDSPGDNDCVNGGNGYDCIRAKLCFWNVQVPGSNEDCFEVFLADSSYLRRIYGFTWNDRRYRGEAEPFGATSLLSFIGIVRRD